MISPLWAECADDDVIETTVRLVREHRLEFAVAAVDGFFTFLGFPLGPAAPEAPRSRSSNYGRWSFNQCRYGTVQLSLPASLGVCRTICPAAHHYPFALFKTPGNCFSRMPAAHNPRRARAAMTLPSVLSWATLACATLPTFKDINFGFSALCH